MDMEEITSKEILETNNEITEALTESIPEDSEKSSVEDQKE